MVDVSRFLSKHHHLHSTPEVPSHHHMGTKCAGTQVTNPIPPIRVNTLERVWVSIKCIKCTTCLRMGASRLLSIPTVSDAVHTIALCTTSTRATACLKQATPKESEDTHNINSITLPLLTMNLACLKSRIIHSSTTTRVSHLLLPPHPPSITQ